MRGIARSAGVDPSLVLQHYGSKAALFTASIQLPAGAPSEALGHLIDVLGVRARALPPEMQALVRSMLTAPEAAGAMRAHLDERIANLAASIGGEDAELRAAVAVSSILGLTVARHFLGLRAIADASDDDVVRVAGEALAAAIGGRRDGGRPQRRAVTRQAGRAPIEQAE